MFSKKQKHILFEEGTEPPGTSPLNYEKREGNYCCVGCGTKLFESKSKYESGSGWPSFFEALPNVFETKIDNLTGSPRTEYHCKKCKKVSKRKTVFGGKYGAKDTSIDRFLRIWGRCCYYHIF